MQVQIVESWGELEISDNGDKIFSRVLQVFIPKVILNQKYLYIKYIGEDDKKKVAYQYFLKYKDHIESSLSVVIKPYNEIDMERLVWIDQVINSYEPTKVEVNIFKG